MAGSQHSISQARDTRQFFCMGGLKADKEPSTGDTTRRDNNEGAKEIPGNSAEALVDQITQNVLAAIQKKNPVPQGENVPCTRKPGHEIDMRVGACKVSTGNSSEYQFFT